MKNSIKNKNKGVTLIALVVTIIVLLILAGVSISTLMGDDGILNKAQEAKFATKIASYQEQISLYVANQMIEDRAFNKEDLIATNTSEVTISDIIQGIGTDKSQYQIVKGKLFYVGSDKTEIENCKKYGIKVSNVVLDENNVILGTNNFEGVDSVYIIPETAEGIATGAFMGNTKLQYVDFSNNDKITNISSNAFRKCVNLKEVNFGSKIISIGDWAFVECRQLKNIVIPDIVEEIGAYAFYDSGIETIQLPNNPKFKTINQSMLEKTLITEINIPDSIEVINIYALSNCKNLTKIHLGKNVNKIPQIVDCPILEDITIDEQNNFFELEKGCIYKEDYTSLVLIPSTIKELNLHNNLVTINASFPKNIQKLELGKSIKTIPNMNDYDNLTTFNINSENEYLKTENGIVYSKDGTKVITALSNIGEVILPSSVTEINSGAFWGNKNMTKIDMSATSIEFLSTNCFRRNSNLIEVSWPKKLNSIADGAFYECYKLSEIIIPEGVKNIGSSAFYNSGLTKVVLPSTLSSMNNPFNYCPKLTNIEIAEGNQTYKVEDGAIYSKDGKSLVSMPVYSSVLKIKDGVEIIKKFAFNSAYLLSEVTLPITVRVIEEYAFNNSTVRKINIPSSIESIGIAAFSSCNNLTEINIDKKEGSITGAPWGATKGILTVHWK